MTLQRCSKRQHPFVLSPQVDGARGGADQALALHGAGRRLGSLRGQRPARRSHCVLHLDRHVDEDKDGDENFEEESLDENEVKDADDAQADEEDEEEIVQDEDQSNIDEAQADQ